MSRVWIKDQVNDEGCLVYEHRQDNGQMGWMNVTYHNGWFEADLADVPGILMCGAQPKDRDTILAEQKGPRFAVGTPSKRTRENAEFEANA